MRIRCHGNAPGVSPCGGFPQGGEVEDYTLNIVSSGANDAGIVAFAAPQIPVSPGLQDVKVSLQNFGTANLTSVNINWMVDGVMQTPVSWTGALGQTSIDTAVLLGSFTFPSGQHNLRAWTSLPNGQPDVVPVNDTSSFAFFACNPLSGNYSIGSSGADFQSVSDASLALQQCGINGPVTFSIQNGTYNEAVILKEVPGASTVNTITFQSLSGNPADVTLTHNASGTSDNYTLLLDGGDHYIIKNLSISAEDSTYAKVIVFQAEASHNSIEGNIINSQIFARTSNNAAGIYSSGSQDDHNVIQGNTIPVSYTHLTLPTTPYV
jgi:hypothetical protein